MIQMIVGVYGKHFSFTSLTGTLAPFKMVRLRGNTIPWVTSNIKKLMRSGDFYKKQANKHNSQIYWDNFKKLRNKVNSELAKAKREFLCNLFEDCANSKDLKHSWQLVNNLLGKIKNQTISPNLNAMVLLFQTT